MDRDDDCAVVGSPNLISFRGKQCILGIDEAGRGPVLGPMVYAVAVCQVNSLDKLKSLKVADSKELTEKQREETFSKIHDEEHSKYFAYALRTLSPMYISNSMLRRIKYNLNEVSHESAIKLIKFCLEHGIRVSEVFVDTVGPPASYQAKLLDIFPSLKITVSTKADSLFPIVSAASICAKVTRDKAVKNWLFLEGNVIKMPDTGTGSGYPGDPMTKEFLLKNVDPVFGFPSIVRFSWSTAAEIIMKQCVKVNWENDNKKNNNKKPEAAGTKSILNFFARMKRPAAGDNPGGKSLKLGTVGRTILDELNIEAVTNL